MTMVTEPPEAAAEKPFPRRDIDPASAACGFLARDGAVALVTVIDTWGSAPVPVGGQMVVAVDGRFAGSVSGGCIESDIIVAAEKSLAEKHMRVLSFGVADETAWRAGLPCGGNIKVLIEPLSKSPDLEVMERLRDAALTREALVVATDLSTGERRVLTRAELSREIAASGLPYDIAWRLEGGDSRLATLAPRPGHTGDRQVFYKTYAPPARLVIVGATHIAQILVELARVAGYGTIVVDPRETYAAPDRFSGIEIVADGPAEAFASIGIDAFTAVVALAHVIHIDDEALKAAMRSNARYIGVLGSRKNRDRRRERLLAEGFSPSDIDRIRSPIGLDIGALTPAEIAVAILAEVIETVRGKRRS